MIVLCIVVLNYFNFQYYVHCKCVYLKHRKKYHCIVCRLTRRKEHVVRLYVTLRGYIFIFILLVHMRDAVVVPQFVGENFHGRHIGNVPYMKHSKIKSIPNKKTVKKDLEVKMQKFHLFSLFSLVKVFSLVNIPFKKRFPTYCGILRRQGFLNLSDTQIWPM